MTSSFKEYVRFYMKIANVETIDAATEYILAIRYASTVIATDRLILYGETEYEPTTEEVVQTIRECCGEDIYKRIFKGTRYEQ